MHELNHSGWRTPERSPIKARTNMAIVTPDIMYAWSIVITPSTVRTITTATTTITTKIPSQTFPLTPNEKSGCDNPILEIRPSQVRANPYK